MYLSFIVNMIPAHDFYLKYYHGMCQQYKISVIEELTVLLLFYILLGMSPTYFITNTSKHGWIMVRVYSLKICLFMLCFKCFFALIILKIQISLQVHLPYWPDRLCGRFTFPLNFPNLWGIVKEKYLPWHYSWHYPWYFLVQSPRLMAVTLNLSEG